MFDFTSKKELHISCIRYAWRGILPAAFLLVLAVVYLLPSPPTNSKLVRRFKRSWTPFLTLDDARHLLAPPEEASSANGESTRRAKTRGILPVAKMAMRLTLPIAAFSLLETIYWLGTLAYDLLLGDVLSTIVSSCQAASWAYTFMRPLLRPTSTPPYDILTLLLIQFGTLSIGFFGYAYDKYANSIPWPATWVLIGNLGDLLIITGLLMIIMSTPLEPIDPKDSIGIDNLASPEDYTTIWGWMTFAFVNPVIEKGSRAPLNESDVFELSPHHRADPLLRRFAKVKGKTLLRRIWTANALDLL